MAEKRKQPEWKLPTTRNVIKLELYNSLTRRKNEFIPINQQRITWYNCGPTVYDSSHMGHARSYITFDIIRRVLQNYFHYNVFFIQNITDIDDKIIRRARQNYLYDQYLQKINQKTKSEILDDLNQSLQEIKLKYEQEIDLDKKSMYNKLITTTEMKLSDDNGDVNELIKNSKDLLSIWLDKHYGHEITDREIFISLPRFYENEFNQDMMALNILPPDCVTRVSEYVPEIIKFIEKIITNGYAYESNGSIYFDTEKFSTQSYHYYAKLVPEAYGDSKSLAEGEGDLTGDASEKRNPNDFALWKNSKPGEPWWPSPWGNGRPGWHIECSAMASSIIGEQSLDIHSGGIDLRFPHHDNEMAQSEAYYDTGIPWVNYFLHSGHLTIAGCKMSKSLKNFITIKDVLKTITARQLRLLFLMHSWKDTLDYSDNTMNDAIHFEKNLNEFFLTVKDILRQNSKQSIVENLKIKWMNDEIDLYEKFNEHSKRIDQALHDNIDTKKCCEEIRRLLTIINIYINNKQNDSNPMLLCLIAKFLAQIMNIFGCTSFIDEQQLIYSFQSIELNNDTNNNKNKEEIILPFIETIGKLRDEIRIIARDLKNPRLFQLCDQIRDNILPELGIRMEDYETNDGKQQWRLKFVDREILLQERLERQKRQEELKNEKLNKNKKNEQQKQSELSIINPKEMFLMELDKYSKFDADGIPTHDVNGEELTKTAMKKIQKRRQLQEKKYNDYLNKQNG